MASDSQARTGTSGANDMEVNARDTRYEMDEEGGLRVDDDIYIPPPLKSFNEVDATGSRLMITQIVNENFKSYAGTHVIGPFQKVNASASPSILSGLILELASFFPAELLGDSGSQRQWQEQRDRLYAVCVRLPRQQDQVEEDLCPDTQF